MVLLNVRQTKNLRYCLTGKLWQNMTSLNTSISLELSLILTVFKNKHTQIRNTDYKFVLTVAMRTNIVSATR